MLQTAVDEQTKKNEADSRYSMVRLLKTVYMQESKVRTQRAAFKQSTYRLHTSKCIIIFQLIYILAISYLKLDHLYIFLFKNKKYNYF